MPTCQQLPVLPLLLLLLPLAAHLVQAGVWIRGGEAAGLAHRVPHPCCFFGDGCRTTPCRQADGVCLNTCLAHLPPTSRCAGAASVGGAVGGRPGPAPLPLRGGAGAAPAQDTQVRVEPCRLLRLPPAPAAATKPATPYPRSVVPAIVARSGTLTACSSSAWS